MNTPVRESVWRHAQIAGVRLSTSPLIIFGQWMGETDNLRHVARANNLAGITVDGVYREFKTLCDFVEAYVETVVRDFPHAAGRADNVVGFVEGLYCGRMGNWAAVKESSYLAMVKGAMASFPPF